MNLFDDIVKLQKDMANTPLVALCARLPGKTAMTWSNDKLDLTRFREKELKLAQPISSSGDYYLFGLYDASSTVRISAILGITQTVVVCLIMSVMTYSLSMITTNLVIHPIEKMMERVEKITQDPLKALQEEEERQKRIKRKEEGQEGSGRWG